MNTTWEDVIRFWFEECSPQQWWGGDSSFDELIRSHFLETHGAVARGETTDWRVLPKGRLAEVIVLDQFSRNMFRGTPNAFAFDSLALALAEEAVQGKHDEKLSKVERQFLYMPFMHSESRTIHEKAIKLFEKIGSSGSDSYEVRHKEIIDRFGRYPHRNAILGRTSTPEEQEFLKTHKGF
ncbi:MAG: DUF924 family protein [Candidatus Moraniibacteriota bacterium]